MMNSLQSGWAGAVPVLTTTLKLGKRRNDAMFCKTATAAVFLTALAVVTMAILSLTAAPASAAISIVSQAEGFVDSTKAKIATAHLGTTLLDYDATGVDKLVVAIGTESGFNNQSVNVTGLTFNGVALTQAVEERTYLGDRDGGTAEIWYLDNPFQGPATFGFTFTSSAGSINGGHASIIGLSGTGAGIGATAAAFTNIGPVTTSITTTANDSLVIAMVENSGSNNASGTPTVQAPLTLSNNGVWGSNWGGTASGYQFVPGAGTAINPTFTANTGDKYSIHTVAVEFTPPVPTVYWDVNDTLAGAGGPVATGTWDGATTNWNPKADGTDPVAVWSAGFTAVFAADTDATDPYTVTVDGTQDITGLKFEEGEVTLANGASGALRLTGTTLLNVASGRTATVAIPVGEDAAGRELAKVGPGTLVLSGDLSYTGVTTIAQGTTVLSGNNAAATGGMALNAGLTQFDSPASINGTARDVTVNAGGTMVFGPAFGAGNIPSALLNRIVDSSAGVIAADNQDATNFDFNASGLIAAYFGAVGYVPYTGTLTPNGTIYRLGGGGGTLVMANTNAVTGAGSSLIVKGDVVLSAANDYDGGTTLTAGTLAVGDDGSLGSGALTFNGGGLSSDSATARTVANGVMLGGNATLGNAVNNGKLTFTGTVDLGIATWTLTVNSDAEFSGDVSGVVGLTKAGPATLTLSNSNTYSGVTTINAGTLVLAGSNSTSGVTLGAATLVIGNAGALGSGTFTISGAGTVQAEETVVTTNAVAANSNFTIDGTGELTLGNLTLNNNRTITNNNTTGATTLGGITGANRTLTFAGNGNTAVIGNITTGTGTVTKNGTGTLTLSGENTYSGVTTISAGVLEVTKLADGGLPSSIGQSGNAGTNLLLGNGATLKYTGAGDNTDRQFRFNGNLAGLGVTLDASGSGPINFTSTTDPTHSNTNQTRTLRIIGSNTGDNTLAALLADNGTGALSIVKDGAGKWILSGFNMYTGTTTISAGTLQATTATALPGYAAGTIAVDAGMLAVNAGADSLTEWGETEIDDLLANENVTFAPGAKFGIDTSSGDFSYGATVDITKANIGLVKLGGNTLTLSSVTANTYDGGTTVNAGTLQVASAGALPPGGSLTINAGGTLVLASGLGAAGVAASTVTAVPEPGTIALLAAGLAALLIATWRRR